MTNYLYLDNLSREPMPEEDIDTYLYEIAVPTSRGIN